MRALTTPVAVLLGISFAGSLVAAAVFFGLRTREVRVVEIASPSTSVGGAAAPSPVSQSATADAARALGDQHAALVKTCWEPFTNLTPKITSIKYACHFLFDADGRQIAGAGTLMAMGASHGEIDQCVGTTLKPLAIGSPGAPIAVDVSITLP